RSGVRLVGRGQAREGSGRVLTDRAPVSEPLVGGSGAELDGSRRAAQRAAAARAAAAAVVVRAGGGRADVVGVRAVLARSRGCVGAPGVGRGGLSAAGGRVLARTAVATAAARDDVARPDPQHRGRASRTAEARRAL